MRRLPDSCVGFIALIPVMGLLACAGGTGPPKVLPEPVRSPFVELERVGAAGFLVGESLMRQPHPGKALEALRRPT